MSNGQKIIKYIAIAFAVFLIVNIVSWSILGLSLLLGITAFGEKEETINEAEQKVQFSEQGEQIKNLKIDISISQLIIQKSNHFNVEVKSEKDIVSATLKENTLYIENTKKEPFFNWNPEDSQIIVSLPSSISLNNVEIDSGVGTVQIEELNCSNLKMDLGVGSAKIGNLIANQAKIDSGAGRLEIQKADITNLDLDCGVGETLITGVLKGENRIEGGVGSVSISLQNSLENYRITTNTGLGPISINNKSCEDKQINGKGAHSIILNGGVGKIDLTTK